MKCNINHDCQSVFHHLGCPKFKADAPEPKPPIYPVAVIEVACRALEALSHWVKPGESSEEVEAAIRIIGDGLLSHEKAIRGES